MMIENVYGCTASIQRARFCLAIWLISGSVLQTRRETIAPADFVCQIKRGQLII